MPARRGAGRLLRVSRVLWGCGRFLGGGVVVGGNPIVQIVLVIVVIVVVVVVVRGIGLVVGVVVVVVALAFGDVVVVAIAVAQKAGSGGCVQRFD